MVEMLKKLKIQLQKDLPPPPTVMQVNSKDISLEAMGVLAYLPPERPQDLVLK